MRLRALQIQFRAEIGAEADSAIVALAIRSAAELPCWPRCSARR
jgi:hypothetical protein